MNNKKGISAVVATVLIILITVAAVTIIWAAIIPMINNQLDQGTLCLDAVSQVTLVDEGYACYDDTTGAEQIKIHVSHGAKDFALADIQVLVSSGGSTTSYLLVEDNLITGDLPGVNEEKVLIFDYDVSDGVPDKVEIAPVVAVGNTRETCDVSATMTLEVCE